MRGAAQGLIAFILWRVEAFVGTILAGSSQAVNTLVEPVGIIANNWCNIWIYPTWGSLAVLVVFIILFREPKKDAKAQAVSKISLKTT